jgi:hypothetical protein
MHDDPVTLAPEESTVEDFYEDDEPLDEVVAAFQRGFSGVTGRPSVVRVEATGVDLQGARTSPMVSFRVSVDASGPARPGRATTTGARAEV